MSKLHIYRKIGSHITKVADGDGAPSHDEELAVKITWGAVHRGITYEIRQGTKPDGSNYTCLAGAGKGETARFERARQEAALLSEESMGAAFSLQSALAATEKTVVIEVSTEDLRVLKAANYRLCFAKKVGEADYNVVWQSYLGYFATNTFSWTPQYQLFGTNLFQAGVRVRTETNMVNIGLGETSTLDEHGVLEPPVTGGPEHAISLRNDYGRIHPGINQLSTGIDGSKVSSPIYVAPGQAVQGLVSLTPIEKVLVWFQQNIETSTMFSDARSRSVEIDLTSTNLAARRYQNEQWITSGDT